MSGVSQAVFLSYASEDANAARRICDALRAASVEVWFDQNELVGGDAWDAKIRRQIQECALFVPIISANTQARLEGYFRIEWKLAAQRTHAMAEAKPFLLPVVIDATHDADAHVPGEFRAVQWTRLAGGGVPPAFVARVRGVIEGAQTDLGTARPRAVARERGEGAAPPATRRRIPAWAWSAIVLMVFAAAGTVLWRTRPKTSGTPAISPHGQDARATSNPAAQPPLDLASAAGLAKADAKSIAVLPFANLSDDKDSAFFADGVHEDILTSLYLIPDLKVISRTSVMQYRGTTKTARAIGDELGVAYVLEGSVRRAGDTVRVTSQLINTRTDHHVWAKSYDKKLTEVFAIQSELAQAIATELEAKLSPRQKQLLEQRPTENATAYDLFLRARELSRASATEEGGQGGRFDPNIEVFLEAALRLDPKFAAAWGRLCEFHAFRFEQDGDRGERNEAALSKARHAMEAVVRLAPASPTALRTSGYFCYAAQRDFACADENYSRLATLQPNDPEIVFMLAWSRWNQSRWSEAVEVLRKSVRLDPGVFYMTHDLAEWLEQGRRYREAQPVRERVARLQPAEALRHSFQAAMYSFLESGSYAEVEAFFAGLTEVQANSSHGIAARRQWAIATGNVTEFLRLERTAAGGGGVNKALALLANGDALGARELLEKQSVALKSNLERTPNRNGLLATMAEVEAQLGRKEPALAWAAKCRELHPWNIPAAAPVRAFVQAWTGDKDRAIAEYARLLQTVGGPNVHVMRRDPRYAPLRGDPRFEALLDDPKNNQPLF